MITVVVCVMVRAVLRDCAFAPQGNVKQAIDAARIGLASKPVKNQLYLVAGHFSLGVEGFSRRQSGLDLGLVTHGNVRARTSS